MSIGFYISMRSESLRKSFYDVFVLLERGLTQEEIAEELGLTLQVVRNYISNAKKKYLGNLIEREKREVEAVLQIMRKIGTRK